MPSPLIGLFAEVESTRPIAPPALRCGATAFATRTAPRKTESNAACHCSSVAPRASVAGGPPTLDRLPELHQVSMIFDETLRLYPPAWSTTRSPLHDDVIGGRRIPRGKFVILSLYVTHRHPDFWPEPDAFRPERFRDGVPTGPRRFAYFPFGGGPRQCLGLTFALTEAKVILATLASRFRPTVAPGYVARRDPQFALRSLGGMPMRLH